MKHLYVLGALVILIGTMTPTAMAQANYFISGTVYRVDGTRCPNAIIEYSIPRTGDGGSVQADGAGNYVFDISQLPHGYQYGDICKMMAVSLDGSHSYWVHLLIEDFGGPQRNLNGKPNINPVVHDDSPVGGNVNDDAISVTINNRVCTFTKHHSDGATISPPTGTPFVNKWFISCWYGIDEWGTGLDPTWPWNLNFRFDMYLKSHANDDIIIAHAGKDEPIRLYQPGTHVWIDPAITCDINNVYHHNFALDIVLEVRITGTNNHGSTIGDNNAPITSEIKDIKYLFY